MVAAILAEREDIFIVRPRQLAIDLFPAIAFHAGESEYIIDDGFTALARFEIMPSLPTCGTNKGTPEFKPGCI